jgi:hypothetical protein
MYSLKRSAVTIVGSAAACIVLSAISPQSAQAFLITRTNSPTPGTLAPLALPTVIDFNSFSNNSSVLTTSTLIAPDTGNGQAFIQLISGAAKYQGNQLNIGTSGNNSPGGIVSFTFDGTKGQGYFGLQWQNPTVDEVISFYSGNSLIQSFTGTQVADQAIGNGGNYYNFIVTNNSEIFNRVDLAQVNPPNGNDFQVDNVAYQQIPTPALLPGIMGIGAGIWKKRRKQEFIEN